MIALLGMDHTPCAGEKLSESGAANRGKLSLLHCDADADDKRISAFAAIRGAKGWVVTGREGNRGTREM